MGKDLVDGVAKFGMLDENVPVFRGRYRYRTFTLHALNDLDELGYAVLVPEHRFIAHDHTRDVGIVPCQVEGRRNLALVSRIVSADPGADRDR